MPSCSNRRFVPAIALALALFASRAALAEGDIHKVKHIIIVMQENHSFDNYFGALAYAPASPYHTPASNADVTGGGCQKNDHSCVDGLSCMVSNSGQLTCFNSNIDDDGHTVVAFHDSRRCVVPDLDHEWIGSHKEANFSHPNDTLSQTLNDGFVRQNDATEQHDNGVENATEDQTMNFYNQDEIPFYYDLAQKFAINDRYFCSMLGPTFPNRSYFLAATSFGHSPLQKCFHRQEDISRSPERFSICWIKTTSVGPTTSRMCRRAEALGSFPAIHTCCHCRFFWPRHPESANCLPFHLSIRTSAYLPGQRKMMSIRLPTFSVDKRLSH